MMSSFLIILHMCIFVTLCESILHHHHQVGMVTSQKKLRQPIAAVLPGSPLITGTLTQGVMNGISLFSNIIFARIALSWFPQLPRQFPILKPIFTVTEPYLRFFRQQIPTIGGFDLSTIPALFCLEILSQTTAAIGAEIPQSIKDKVKPFSPPTSTNVKGAIVNRIKFSVPHSHNPQ